MRRLIVLVAAVALCACSGEEGGCGPDEIWDAFGESCREKLPDRSTEGSGWSPGTPAFIEATSKWRLDSIGVEGVRLSVADVDDDGWPDLSVRKGGAGADDFAAGGSRVSWLLRNQEGQSFADITQSSGLVARREGSRTLGRPVEIVVWADVNNDGAVDALVGASGSEGAELMLNDGRGNFIHGPRSFPGLQPNQTLASAVFLDANLDGWVDLFLAHGATEQDRLLLNVGEGSFRDFTERAGIVSLPWDSLDDLDAARAHSNAWGAVACDLNGDGLPEILVSSYGRAPNHLWLSRASGEYLNHSIASGYAFDHRMDWRDNESARCHCKLHPEDEECGSVPPPERVRCESPDDIIRWNHEVDRRPFRLGGNSATTVCADINGDGHLDLLTTEIVHWDVGSSSDPSEILFHRGDDPPSFARPGNEETGLIRQRSREDWNDGDMTAAVFDFDNDGRPDIYIGSSDYPGTRGRLFWQTPEGRFLEVPVRDGIDHKSSHGIAIADFNRDGGLDIAVGHSRVRCEDQCYERGTVRLFENLIGSRGNWLQLDLRGGEGSNRMAIGARVEVEAGGRTQVQEVGGGHGHYGIQHEHALHFGLGAAREARVVVHWPDQERSTSRFTLQAGYRYRVEQGKAPFALKVPKK